MPAVNDGSKRAVAGVRKPPRNEIAEKGTWWVRHTLWEIERAAQFADQRIFSAGHARMPPQLSRFGMNVAKQGI